MIFETCIPPAFVDTDREREILRVPMADCLDQLQLGLAQPHIYPPSYTRRRPASIGDLVIFQRIGIAELERPDDFLAWRLMTVENPVEQCAVNALPSRPGRLASRSFYLRAKQADDVFVVENTHTDLTDNLRPNSLAVMRGSLGEIGGLSSPPLT
jgi:hypothetical protein